MKKCIAILLALLLFVGTALAESDLWICPQCMQENVSNFCTNCGTKRSDAGSFAETLQRWQAGLSLRDSDYALTYTDPDGTLNGLIRQSDGVTEISIDALGTLQITDQTVALRLPSGETLIIDLASILSMAQGQLDMAGIWQEDWELLGDLLSTAIMEILLPSVKVAYSWGSITLHISMDDVTIRQRAYAFIDGLLADEALCERIWARYGQSLQLIFPGLPGTLEELRSAWQGLPESSATTQGSSFALEADVLLSQRDLYQKFVCTGHMQLNQYQYGFEVEYLPEADGFSVSAGITQTSYYSFDQYTLLLDCHGSQVTGSLTSRGTVTESYELTAFLDERNIEARLTYHGQSPDMDEAISLLGEIDPDRRTYAFSLDWDKYSSGAEGFRTTNLAALSGSYWDQGITGALTTPSETLSFRGLVDQDYAHLTISSLSASRKEGADMALWIMREGYAGYTIRFEQRANFQGWPRSNTIASLSLRPSQISIQYEDLITGRKITGSAHYFEYADTLDVGIEYLDTLGSYWNRRNTGNPVPLKAQLTRNGQKYTLSFSGSGESDALLGELVMLLNDNGDIASLEGVLDQISPRGMLSHGTVSYVPGHLALVMDRDVITVTKLLETPQELRYGISVNDDPEVIFCLALREGSLICSLGLMDQEVISLRITPVEKTPITRFSPNGAVVLDAETLMLLLE